MKGDTQSERAKGEVIMMTSISFSLGNRRRVFAHSFYYNKNIFLFALCTVRWFVTFFVCFISSVVYLFVFFSLFLGTLSYCANFVFSCTSDSISGPRVLLSLILNK